MKGKDFLVKKLDKWTPPEKNDARILSMPNIYYALQGKGLQPRTIEGNARWNEMRKLCYYKAGYKCEVCGAQAAPFTGGVQAHEVFSTNWKEGYAEFNRLVCLCPVCHLQGVHSGRALTLYQRKDPMMPKAKLIAGVEHVFKVVHDWNETHGEDEQILLYSTFIDYWRERSLHDDMERLFKAYGIKCYGTCKPAEWSRWHLRYKGKKYYTPYKDIDDYHKQMGLQHKTQNDRAKKISDRRHKAAVDLATASSTAEVPEGF